MEELVGIILECVAELLLGLILDGLSRLIRRLLVGTRRMGPLLGTILFASVGFAAGVLSLWLFPHPLIHPLRVHGLSLILAPLCVGGLMAYLGQSLRKRGRRSVAIESFRYGFTFALAISLVRFFFVTRIHVQ